MSHAALPTPIRPFVDFPRQLRAHGFAVAPEQTMDWIAAIGALGPRHMDDLYQSARALLAPQPERIPEFDALFRAFFMGQTLAAPAAADADDDELRVHEDGDSLIDTPEADQPNESGQQATSGEVLSARGFAEIDEATLLRQFRRAAPRRLPRRSACRRIAAKTGDGLNMRRALRDAVRTDGEVMRLPKLERKHSQRRVLLLIDVSGSMKNETDAYLRFAHVLGRVAERMEVFTLGTRLTRITRAIRRRRADQALAATSGLVADWDGGTRIGDALNAFLAVPRFAGFARGAAVIVLSDGLERGDHGVMADAVERLARLAWRITWLTPLAGGADFAPETAALRAIHPFVDQWGDASSLDRLCARVLAVGEEAP